MWCTKLYERYLPRAILYRFMNVNCPWGLHQAHVWISGHDCWKAKCCHDLVDRGAIGYLSLPDVHSSLKAFGISGPSPTGSVGQTWTSVCVSLLAWPKKDISTGGMTCVCEKGKVHQDRLTAHALGSLNIRERQTQRCTWYRQVVLRRILHFEL